jgi:hypothetical protein
MVQEYKIKSFIIIIILHLHTVPDGCTTPRRVVQVVQHWSYIGSGIHTPTG